MRDVRNSRHTLLIEKCRQLDPRKVADPDKMRVVGKMFVKVPHIVQSTYKQGSGDQVSALV